MALIRKEGFDFEFDTDACEPCNGRCCRGESGDIWVNMPEIESISRYLKTTVFSFIETYLHRVGNRFTIRERHTGSEYECVFLSETGKKQCRIYPVRPAQCQLFPFWSYYRTRPEALFKECTGVRPIQENS